MTMEIKNAQIERTIHGQENRNISDKCVSFGVGGHCHGYDPVTKTHTIRGGSMEELFPSLIGPIKQIDI